MQTAQKPVFKPINPVGYLLEAGCWVTGLVALAFLNPAGPHFFSLCPFSWFSEDFCMGCGLGHAVAYLFQGQVQASWQAHPLGLPAVVLLSWRIRELIKNYVFLRSYHLTQK